MERFNYIIFYTFALLVMITPPWIRRWFIKILASFAYAVASRYRHIIKVNLDIAFKDSMCDSQKRAIAKQCFINLLTEVISVIEIYFSSKEKYPKLIEVQGSEHIEKAHKDGKGIVFFTNHNNNLEIAAIGLAKVSKTVQVVQKSKNKYINDFITKSREKYGLKIIYMDKALRYFATQLKKGGDVSLVVDQSVNPDAGIIVDFFGQPTMHLSSASFLTRKFDASLIPVSLSVKEDGTYICTIHPPVPFKKSEDETKDIHYLTQYQAHFLEEEIKKDPTTWFWCHRRWKTTLPEIYNR